MKKTAQTLVGVLGLIIFLGCGGAGSNDGGGALSVADAYALNISGISNADIKIDGRFAFNGVHYGNRLGPLRLTQLQAPVPVALHGHGEALPIYTGDTGLSLNMGFVAMGSPLDPFIRAMHLIEPNSPKARLHVVLGDWAVAQAYDVYVTPPGADLTHFAPVASNRTFAKTGADLLDHVDIDPGSRHQVRLCAPGTKNVLNDLGSIPAIGGTVTRGWNYVLATSNDAGASTSLLYALPPFRQ